ncbi:hypothetical protein AB6A40_000042 [Gnathostoma spinigerum]|uniref:EF-hand domain-containing protein n=1 Tax=Gnathostoma spinigerum TaxID=75299 RepID=A0ABD6E9F4_9BILA
MSNTKASIFKRWKQQALEERFEGTNPERLVEYKQAFHLFDKGSTNTINAKDLGNAMRALGQNPTEQELLDMVNSIDIDGCGLIEFGDFCRMMRRVEKETDGEMILEAFRVFDRDGNGFITADEFKYFMTNLGEQFSVKEVEEIIAEVDMDGNGQIDYEEFVKMMVM